MPLTTPGSDRAESASIFESRQLSNRILFDKFLASSQSTKEEGACAQGQERRPVIPNGQTRKSHKQEHAHQNRKAAGVRRAQGVA